MLHTAISPPRPRTDLAFAWTLLIAGVAAAVGIASRIAREAGSEPNRRAIASAQVSEFSAFGAIDRAYCTARGERLVPVALPHDPWGNPYMFICNPHTITVVSAGEDGVYDTTDDLRSDR